MKPARSASYLAWLRTLACRFCNAARAEPAHTGLRGLGQKASDFEAVPMCRICHERYHVHALSFWSHFGLDRLQVIRKLNERYTRATGRQCPELSS